MARRKSRRKSRTRSRARRSNPVRAVARRSARRPAARRRSYRRRRNPLGFALPSFGGMKSGFMAQAMDAVMGAGGAVANDALFTYVPTPAILKTGIPAIALKAVGAIAVGYLGGMMLGKNRGAQLAQGALTVLAYSVIKPMVGTVVPLAGSEIEGLGFYSPGMILSDSLSPLPDLNAGTPLAAYISGIDNGAEGGYADSTIDAYIS